MKYTFKIPAYRLLLFIWLIFFIQCDCTNSNKGTHKPNSKKSDKTPSDNKKPNGKQRENSSEDPTPPLSNVSLSDIRVIELAFGGKSKFLVDRLRALKDDPSQVDMDSRDNEQDGETILHAAVKYNFGKPSMIKDLVKLGAKVNAQDNNGQTPLHTAIHENNIEATQILVDQGASVGILDKNGYTPLHLAAKNPAPEIMQALLKKASKDQINTPDANKYTPLHTAVLHGNLPAVQALLQKGADVNVFTPNGRNALHLAAARGYLDIFKKLVEAGADITTKTRDNKTARDLTQNKDIIKLIDGVAPPVEQVQNDLIDALIIEGNHPFLVDMLLRLDEEGIDINSPDPDKEGSTALQQAAELGNPKLVKILLDHGAKLDLQDHDGETALHKAARKGHLEIVKLLLAHGAAVDISSSDLSTPLFDAARGDHLEVIRELVDHGANLNVKVTQHDYTPLYLAAERENIPILKYLLSKNVNINIQNADGITPLYIASVNGKVEAVKSLIEHGADVNLAMFGMPDKTPLHAASGNGHLAIVQLLLGAGAKVQQAYILSARTEEIRKLLQSHRNAV